MKKVQFELRPDRAFVLHLDVRAKLPHRVVGRIEHVTSGQVSHVTSLDELMAFMAKVLRNQARRGRATLYATVVEVPRQSGLASSARGFLQEDGDRAAGRQTPRGRKRGADS